MASRCFVTTASRARSAASAGETVKVDGGLLAQGVAQMLAYKAAHHVHAASSGVGHDQPDRLVRIVRREGRTA